MHDARTPTRPERLTNGASSATLEAGQDTVAVSRAELEQEHLHLLGRVQQLRRLLGYPPLPTGKQVRRAQGR